MTIEPDAKDWTWVLERPCAECGFTPEVPDAELPARIRAAVGTVHHALHDADVRERPDESTWSKLEYAAHVRDVCRIRRERLDSRLQQDDPLFANWDQDATAVEEAYGEQRPPRVAIELDVAAADLSDAYASVPADAWERPGRRSNGSRFTVRSLGVYALHDLEHHAWDVTKG